VQLLPLQGAKELAVAGEVAQVEQRGPGGVVLGGELVAGLEIADPYPTSSRRSQSAYTSLSAAVFTNASGLPSAWSTSRSRSL